MRAGSDLFFGRGLRRQEFHKSLNKELEFALVRHWTIVIVPKPTEGDCQELASVVNGRFRGHSLLLIDGSYGWTAEQEVSASPREFNFVANCAEYKTELERLSTVLWPYTATKQQYEKARAKLGSSRQGKGRLWITDSKVSHSGDKADAKFGKIEWMKFAVEIKLP